MPAKDKKIPKPKIDESGLKDIHWYPVQVGISVTQDPKFYMKGVHGGTIAIEEANAIIDRYANPGLVRIFPSTDMKLYAQVYDIAKAEETLRQIPWIRSSHDPEKPILRTNEYLSEQQVEEQNLPNTLDLEYVLSGRENNPDAVQMAKNKIVDKKGNVNYAIIHMVDIQANPSNFSIQYTIPADKRQQLLVKRQTKADYYVDSDYFLTTSDIDSNATLDLNFIVTNAYGLGHPKEAITIRNIELFEAPKVTTFDPSEKISPEEESATPAATRGKESIGLKGESIDIKAVNLALSYVLKEADRVIAEFEKPLTEEDLAKRKRQRSPLLKRIEDNKPRHLITPETSPKEVGENKSKYLIPPKTSAVKDYVYDVLHELNTKYAIEKIDPEPISEEAITEETKEMQQLVSENPNIFESENPDQEIEVLGKFPALMTMLEQKPQEFEELLSFVKKNPNLKPFESGEFSNTFEEMGGVRYDIEEISLKLDNSGYVIGYFEARPIGTEEISSGSTYSQQIPTGEKFAGIKQNVKLEPIGLNNLESYINDHGKKFTETILTGLNEVMTTQSEVANLPYLDKTTPPEPHYHPSTGELDNGRCTIVYVYNIDLNKLDILNDRNYVSPEGKYKDPQKEKLRQLGEEPKRNLPFLK